MEVPARHRPEKIGTVAADLGSVNQVIDAEIQDHFTPGGTGRRAGRLSRATTAT